MNFSPDIKQKSTLFCPVYVHQTMVIIAWAFLCAGCSPETTPSVRKSAANGGPEDPTILEIERIGGSCFRANLIQDSENSSGGRFQKVDDNPVVSVYYNGQDPAALLQTLDGLPHLQKLHIYSKSFSDDDAKKLAKFQNLRELVLEGTTCLTQVGFRELARLGQLRHLDISRTGDGIVDDDCLKELKPLRNLQSLWTGGDKISDTGFHHLASLNQLQCLFIPAPRVTEAGIAELEALPQLTELSLRGTSISKEKLRQIGKLGRLKKLDLAYSTVNSADFGEMNSLASLREFDLWGAKSVTDIGLEELAKLPKLTALKLGCTNIRGATFRELSNSPSLENLNLFDTHVTNEALMELVPLKSLRWVELVNTDVTDRGLDRFIRAHGTCHGRNSD